MTARVLEGVALGVYEKWKYNMKYFSILIICFSMICCTKTVKIEKSEIIETESYSEYENRIVAYTTKQRGISVNEIRFRDINFQDLPIEVKGLAYKYNSYGVYSDTGTYCLTNINEDNVNVRNYPSLEGKNIYKL